nr:hypothetical protein [Thiocapsa sp. KS1]
MALLLVAGNVSASPEITIPSSSPSIPSQEMRVLGSVTALAIDPDNIITFSEFPNGTAIANQYANRGIVFGGDTPFITSDGANPTSPVLSGTPRFDGAIEGRFVDPKDGTTPISVGGFSLDGGYFNALGSVRLTWYALDGSEIGNMISSKLGIETFIVQGGAIARWRIEIINYEPGGFAIDNVSIRSSRSFWSELQSGLGALSIRNGYSTSNTVLKQLPDGWALEVTSVYDDNGIIATGNGYRWYQVKDWTDGTTGWMQAGRWENGAFVGDPFLPDDLPNQASLKLDATGTYISRAERANAISVLLEHYYNADNSDKTLLGGVRNAYLKKNAFPVQVFAAMTLRESSIIDFDNEWVTFDYGHGIKQVTSREYVGGASKISIPECEGSSDKREACYTPINPANNYSPKRYTIDKRYYANTALGMTANVKDGFNVLIEKHQGSIRAIPLTESPTTPRTWKAPTDQYIKANNYLGTQYVVSEQEMRVLRTTRAYNGLGPDCKRFNVDKKHEYLKVVADEMKNVETTFPTLPKDGEAPPFQNLVEKMKAVEIDKENISLCSPGVLRIIDKEGRVTGYVGPDLVDEIPTVVYDTEAGKAAVVHLIDQRYRYQVVGIEAGIYTLYIDKTTPDGVVTVQLTNVPLSLGEVYTYSVDWEAVRRGERGVRVEIDRDGDGTPEEVFTVGATVDDTAPPTTTHNRRGGTVYLDADDGEGVGVSSISVSLNGEAWKKVSGVGTQVLLRVGENHLRFYATDHLGNTEAEQSLTVHLQETDIVSIPTTSPWGLVVLILTLPGIAGIAFRIRAKGRGKGRVH